MSGKTIAEVIVLKKRVRFNRVWRNLKKEQLRQWSAVSKLFRELFDRARPFLHPKYWVIYLLAFGLGVYWCIPGRIHRKAIWLGNNEKSTSERSIGTLEAELAQLKQELQEMKALTVEADDSFEPESFIQPVAGRVVQGFDWINQGNVWRLNTGVDLAVEAGNSVVASGKGIVTEVREAVDGSFTVRLKHGNGWESRYGNLAQVLVGPGDKVISGMVLGSSGAESTPLGAAGIRFEIYHLEQPIDPGKYVESLRSN